MTQKKYLNVYQFDLLGIDDYQKLSKQLCDIFYIFNIVRQALLKFSFSIGTI